MSYAYALPSTVGQNPVLLKLARHVAYGGGAEKSAVVPAGGGAPPPGDPAAAGMPPGDPAAAGGMPPPGGPMPPGGDPAAMMAPPPAPGGGAAVDPAMQAMMMMQAQGGGPMGKGKSPKDQIQQGQQKITIHLLAQIAQKLGIQVDPMLLVPMTDPSTDQMAMTEMQNAAMVPSTDPMAGGGAPPGGAPPAAPPGPPPVEPMAAGQGPIGGKAASIGQAWPRSLDLIAASPIGPMTLADRARAAMAGMR